MFKSLCSLLKMAAIISPTDVSMQVSHYWKIIIIEFLAKAKKIAKRVDCIYNYGEGGI